MYKLSTDVCRNTCILFFWSWSKTRKNKDILIWQSLSWTHRPIISELNGRWRQLSTHLNLVACRLWLAACCDSSCCNASQCCNNICGFANWKWKSNGKCNELLGKTKRKKKTTPTPRVLDRSGGGAEGGDEGIFIGVWGKLRTSDWASSCC